MNRQRMTCFAGLTNLPNPGAGRGMYSSGSNPNGKSLGVQFREWFAKVGSCCPVRENFCLTPEVKAKFTEKLKADPTELGGRKVAKVVRTGGLKLILNDGTWVCSRLPAAEPVVRACTEARSEKDMESLRAAAGKFVMS
jgi:phosphomannomutase